MIESVLKKAVAERSVVTFAHQNVRCVAETHVLGVGRTGRVQLLCFQVGGRSSAPLPGWRRFDLEDITNVSVTGTHFLGPRPAPDAENDWVKVIISAT